jgi:hypothetical protein
MASRFLPWIGWATFIVGFVAAVAKQALHREALAPQSF